MKKPVNSDSVAQDMLISFVRRVESVEDEKKALNEDLSEIYKEVRGAGFDVKVLKRLISDRRKDSTELAEFETLYDLYAVAIGMRPGEVAGAHVENADEFDAETGEILESTEPPDDHETVGRDAREPRPDVSSQPIQESHDATSLPLEDSGVSTSSAGTEGEQTGTSIQDNKTVEVIARSPVPSAPILTFTPKPLRPHCLRPQMCGGMGKDHCHSCQLAMDSERATA